MPRTAVFVAACLCTCLSIGVGRVDDFPVRPTLQINVSGASMAVLLDATGRVCGDADSTAAKIPNSTFWAVPPGGSASGGEPVRHFLLRSTPAAKYVLVCEAVGRNVGFEGVGRGVQGDVGIDAFRESKAGVRYAWQLTWCPGNEHQAPSLRAKRMKHVPRVSERRQ
jgi:hypothetical protein